MSDFYSINDLARMTGLTTRTLRNYINAGTLSGEKDEGVWRFSGRDLETFFANSGVQRAVRAAQKAILYDYLLDERKKTAQICAVIDVPTDDPKRVSGFFCEKMKAEAFGESIQFAYERQTNQARVILRGGIGDVNRLLAAYEEWSAER